MKLQLNNLPDLSMAEITRKLFNSKFLSDIQFRLGDQVIYAHSLELMKRSVVFQHMLETTLGDSKLIPIPDFNYGSFYEFIRFIYTDLCDFSNKNIFDVYKLAIKYKVPKLENKAMEFLNSSNYTLRLFDICLELKLELPLGRILENLAHELAKYLENDEFLSIKPQALERILKLNNTNAKESQLLRGLMLWMDNEMAKNPVSLREGRVKFDKYIQLIRFSAMSLDEVLESLSKKYTWFTENDFNLIFRQIEDGCRRDQHKPNCKCRLCYSFPYDWITIPSELVSPTVFTVSRELILIGIRYGNDTPETNHLIQISSANSRTNTTNTFTFKNTLSQNKTGSRIYSFGDFLKLEPNIRYTLRISYLDRTLTSSLLLRKSNQYEVIRAPRNTVNIIKAGLNIFEMHFKSVPEEDNLIVLD